MGPMHAADLPGFPADLADEFDNATARLAEIEQQVDALNAERAPLRAQRQAALDLYAETTDDPATLLTIATKTSVAHRKVEAHVRSLHPRLFSYNQPYMTDWNDMDEAGKPKTKPVMLTGTNLALMPRQGRTATTDDAKDIAAALIEFARIYTPNPVGLLPEWGMGDHTGMVHCDIITEHDQSPTIWYAPDGKRAAYYDDTTNGHTGYTEPVTGTLVEVLRHAITDAARPVPDDENGYDW
jgi:hypothetical protein